MVQVKESLKICQCVVVVAVVAMVQIKESLKICQCSSSRSYSANKRVVQNLSECKTLLFAILLPHSEKKSVIMVLQIKESFEICQGVVVVVKIKESFQIRQSVVVEVQIRESFKICQCYRSSANKIVVQNLSDRRSSSAIEMSFEV